MVRLKTVRLIDTTDISDGSVVTSKIADGAVVTSKIADAAVVAAKIAAEAVTDSKIAPSVLQYGEAAIDSVATWVLFPSAFPGVPEVVAVGKDVTGVKITDITAGSFEWVAAAAGSAIWVALYRS